MSDLRGGSTGLVPMVSLPRDGFSFSEKFGGPAWC